MRSGLVAYSLMSSWTSAFGVARRHLGRILLRRDELLRGDDPAVGEELLELRAAFLELFGRELLDVERLAPSCGELGLERGVLLGRLD